MHSRRISSKPGLHSPDASPRPLPAVTSKMSLGTPDVPRPQTQLGLRTIKTEVKAQGGSVVKNPPANAGHTGPFPGPERPLTPQSN